MSLRASLSLPPSRLPSCVIFVVTFENHLVDSSNAFIASIWSQKKLTMGPRAASRVQLFLRRPLNSSHRRNRQHQLGYSLCLFLEKFIGCLGFDSDEKADPLET